MFLWNFKQRWSTGSTSNGVMLLQEERDLDRMYSNRYLEFFRIWSSVLIADRIHVNSYEADFTQGLHKKNEKKITRSFNVTFRYIDDVLSLNNSRLGDFVDRRYPIELEIKVTTDTDMSASYLDLHLEIMLLHINGTFTMEKLKSTLLS
jgi:hypothetical protein